jgi:ABC-type transport system substrate-binding protein
LDPQAAYTTEELEVLRCCLTRTLMAYPGISGFAGTQPVPDLAAGPPHVSADGRTWTFHLRHGIHYAPPLQDVEVTSPDFVRALLRTGRGILGADGGPVGFLSTSYLNVIDGYQQFVSGSADSISGVTTPDAYTLQVRETVADRSLLFLMAEPFAAPIPPSPTQPQALLGIATGHDAGALGDFLGAKITGSSARAPKSIGYGPFLAATGPYMIEGADKTDYTLPAADQSPPSGFRPAWWDDQSGGVTLVRNPSWHRSSDPIRWALADRIVLSYSPRSPYPALLSGRLDTVIGGNPPAGVVNRYARLHLQAHVLREPSNGTDFVMINVAQPPFDDVHVRRALALSLGRAAVARSAWPTPSQQRLTTHLVPDPLENALLAGWNGVGGTGSPGDLAAARSQMRQSRYGDPRGRCQGPTCDSVKVNWPYWWARGLSRTTRRALERPLIVALAKLGMTAKLTSDVCWDPRKHIPLCVYRWSTDYPDAGSMLTPFRFPDSTTGLGSMMGAPARLLRRLGYPPTHAPTINSDYARCAADFGPQVPLCWARLDQMLVSTVVAAIPLDVPDVVRLAGRGVTSFGFDQAFTEPALDRIATASAPASP